MKRLNSSSNAWRTFAEMVAILSFCLSVSQAMAAEPAEEPEEGAPIVFARDLLKDVPLRTAFYVVQPMVEVKDFAYEFRIESEHGEFRVYGLPECYKVLHELEVIEILEEVSQGEALATSLSSSLTEPILTTVGVARRPVSSVTGLPGGLARYLGGKLYQARRSSGKAVTTVRSFGSKNKEESAEEKEEEKKEDEGVYRKAGKLSRKYLGHDKAKRKWSRRLEVDPYSDNGALQDALARIAWASSLGDFAGDFVVPSSEVFSYAGRAQELVWERPPHQLEREIIRDLRKCGFSDEKVFAFRDAETLSLSEKVEITLALSQLKQTEGIDLLLDRCLEAETQEEIRLHLGALTLLVNYQRQVSGIQRVSQRNGVLYAYAENGYEVYPLAVDYLHWTPLAYEAFLSQSFHEVEKKELRVSGKVSPVSEMRLRHHGWHVFDEAGLRLAAGD